ncbi:MAG: hypothetical protein GX031_10030, partial [Candidatus Riflebacteria bacterium]|nr:hypothetical protein [Candidatus Riflebacteria bacterium]
LETYIKTIEIEHKMAVNIARTMILPAITKQITLTGKAASALRQSNIISAEIEKDLAMFESLYNEIKTKTKNLENSIARAYSEKDTLKVALYFGKKGAKALAELRSAVDKAEELISDDFWPMTKYQKLLTIF